MRESETGQTTVEWVGLLLLVGLLLTGLLAAGGSSAGGLAGRGGGVADPLRRLAGGQLWGRADVDRRLRDRGGEAGPRPHAWPTIAFEWGARALPVDFRRCRSTECGDGPQRGDVRRASEGLPRSAFVHVVDCRPGEAERSEAKGEDCPGARAGNLYIQYCVLPLRQREHLRRIRPRQPRRGSHRDARSPPSYRSAKSAGLGQASGPGSGELPAELDRSGADDSRPILQGAIERIERGELDGVIVWNFARFTRSLASSVAFLEAIEQAGGQRSTRPASRSTPPRPPGADDPQLPLLDRASRARAEGRGFRQGQGGRGQARDLDRAGRPVRLPQERRTAA